MFYIWNFCWLEKLWQYSECSECYCGWCGGSTDLVSCKSCENLFCTSCIKRNIGMEYLSEAQSSVWKCCCCCPSLLQNLTSQLEKSLDCQEFVISSSDSDSDNSDADIDALRYLNINYKILFCKSVDTHFFVLFLAILSPLSSSLLLSLSSLSLFSSFSLWVEIGLLLFTLVKCTRTSHAGGRRDERDKRRREGNKDLFLVNV